MKGLNVEHMYREGRAGELTEWEAPVLDAVGNVIEFWGFKANQGRVWALLYLRGRPFTATEIGRALALSKGAVSMVTREMEQWGVLHRVRGPGAGAWLFEAEVDFLRMISRVVEAREGVFLARVKADLERAEEMARSSAPPDALKRISRMRSLASLVERAVGVFLKTSRFDVTGALGILTGRTGASEWNPPRASSPATSKDASEPSTKARAGSSATRRKR